MNDYEFSNTQKHLFILMVGILGIGILMMGYRYFFIPREFPIITAPEQAIVIRPHPVEDHLLIHVAGAVRSPGVYHVSPGQRAMELIALSGGLLPTADIDKVNLVKRLKDGQRLYIPFLKSVRSRSHDNGSRSYHTSHKIRPCVSISRGSHEDLISLPGIGPATAKKIILYRQKMPFNQIQSLTNVTGIGNKTMSRIKNYICL